MKHTWLAGLLATMGFATAPAWGQAPTPPWPTREIKIVVAFPAGGVIDQVTRLIAHELQASLGQPVVVEAKPGAGGRLATEQVGASAADGYTWLSTSYIPFTTQASLYPNLRFDPLRDFAPVANAASTTHVLVVPAAATANTLKEFIGHTQSRKGQLSYASSGSGAGNHLAVELLKKQSGMDILHVPYRGQPAAVADLVSNRVHFMALSAALAKPLIDAGKIKALAVIDPERTPLLPEVPTLAESGYAGATAQVAVAFFMPAKTPPAVVQRANAAIMKVLALPDVVAKLNQSGNAVVRSHDAEAFRRDVHKEAARWATVIQDANIQVSD